jgi:hypothetical protein
MQHACTSAEGPRTTSGAVQSKRTNSASATPLGPVWVSPRYPTTKYMSSVDAACVCECGGPTHDERRRPTNPRVRFRCRGRRVRVRDAARRARVCVCRPLSVAEASLELERQRGRERRRETPSYVHLAVYPHGPPQNSRTPLTHSQSCETAPQHAAASSQRPGASQRGGVDTPARTG